jgi:hypothetical protein
LVGGFGPNDGVGPVVPTVYEGSYFGVEVFDEAKAAAVDGLAFDDAPRAPLTIY